MRRGFFFSSIVLFGAIGQAVMAALPPDIQKIRDHRELVVALPAEDSPPFFMRDASGDLSGLDVQIARGMAAALGVAIRFDRAHPNYDDVVDAIANGKADIGLGHLTINLDRAQRVSFSNPYLVMKDVLILNRLSGLRLKLVGEKDPSEKLNMENVTLGAVEGSANKALAMRDFPKAKLQTFKTESELYQAVEKGTIDVILGNRILAKGFMRSTPRAFISVEIVDRVNRFTRLGMAIHWKNANLLQWVNIFLASTEADGTFKSWMRDYPETKDLK